MKLRLTQVSSYTGIFFSSDLLCRFVWITIFSSLLGSLHWKRDNSYIELGLCLYKQVLYWKRDNSYIELMTCCQQRAFFLLRTALKPLNWIWRKLIESKISMSSTKFGFFWADQKTKMWQQMWHIVLRCTICGPLGLLLFARTLFFA